VQTRRTCAKSFAKVDHTDYEIITLEVQRKVFFPYARQGQQTLTARGAKFFNYAILSFCTIVMHIMLGTCVPNLRGRWWVQHTQMHPALKKGKISIPLASLEEFLVISIFHEIKIPIIDLKVQMYSKFRKNKIWKKVKSPISMRMGIFNTSKCRGKLQKMGLLYTHSPKSPGPFPKLPKKKFKKKG
jgi:hypothetical protein